MGSRLPAIELALHHRPGLIILDVAMPVLNGLETARELRKIMPGVPIILFTQRAYASKGLAGIHMIIDRIVPRTISWTCKGTRPGVDRFGAAR
jgi:DNA-binding response OmpR family regulator